MAENAISTSGFDSILKETEEEKNIGALFRQALPQDLIKFGLIPEFIGRLPVAISLTDLDEEALVKILTTSKPMIAAGTIPKKDSAEKRPPISEGLVKILRNLFFLANKLMKPFSNNSEPKIV